jgi:hypothetical protein
LRKFVRIPFDADVRLRRLIKLTPGDPAPIGRDLTRFLQKIDKEL